MSEAKKKAEEHWKFLQRWLRMVYVDAFIHGYKHGRQDKVKRERAQNKYLG